MLGEDDDGEVLREVGLLDEARLLEDEQPSEEVVDPFPRFLLAVALKIS